MAKTTVPEPRSDGDPPTTAQSEDRVVLAPDARPGPDDTPVDVFDTLDAPPDPAVFEIPEPGRLTKGQVEGLQKEGIEAYLFGERVRHDAAGRRWHFQREQVDSLWNLMIRVQLGPVLLVKGGLPLDRIPSAEGEHQLMGVIEAMAEQASLRQAELRHVQQKTAREQAHERHEAERAQEKADHEREKQEKAAAEKAR
jgi:hypothetical protein